MYKETDISEDLIYDNLLKIFKKRTNINFDKNHELKKEKLFGPKIEMPPRELVLLLFDIEKYFSISIPENDLLSENFNSFNNIYNIIKKTKDSINF